MSLLDDYQNRAVIEVVLVGVLAGTVGVQVVLRRLAFFTMAMTHATFPGVVLAAVLGLDLYAGGFVAGLLLAGWVTLGQRRPGQQVGTVSGVALATGFALGAALLSTQAGFTRNLAAYLAGSVLTVDRRDLYTAAVVTLIVGVGVLALSKELIFTGFDPHGAAAAGYSSAAATMVVLVAVQATISAAVPAVGAMLCVALIVAPAATARLWTDRLWMIHLVAVVLAVGSGLIGLIVSRRFEVAAGAAITLTATAAFGLSWWVAPALRRRAQAIVRLRSSSGSG